MRLDIQLFADAKLVLETELDTTGVEEGLDDLPKKLKIGDIVSKLKSKLSPLFKNASKTFQKVGTKISEIAKQTASFMGDAFKFITSLGVGLSGALGVVALIGLAFAGVASAVEKVATEHQDVITKIQYIIYVLKQGIQPIIDWIANAVVSIIQKAINGALFLVALIARLTGRTLPSGKDFADNMKNANKSSAGVAKNAKEIKKQLAGFDEMNIIQDNSGGGAGGIGASTPDIGGLDNAIDEANRKVDNLFAKISEWWDKHWLKKLLDQWKEDWAVGWDAIKVKWNEFKENWLIGWGIIKDWFSQVWDGIKAVVGPIIETIWNNVKILCENVINILTFVWNSIKTTYGPVVEWFLNIFTTIWNNIKSIFTPTADFFKSVFSGALTGIMSVFAPIVSFFSNIWNSIKAIFKGWGSKVGEIVGGAFKAVVNGVLNAIESILNTPIKAINKLINTINALPGIKLKNLSTFKLPRLAKGGIINMPGKGTLVGSAIAGESGREAILPLTDSQQMELLGEAIGRYITINANITNTMNGRIISRELQKINNENSFAGNR